MTVLMIGWESHDYLEDIAVKPGEIPLPRKMIGIGKAHAVAAGAQHALCGASVDDETTTRAWTAGMNRCPRCLALAPVSIEGL